MDTPLMRERVTQLYRNIDREYNRLLESYPGIEEFVPLFLRGPKLIEAHLCTDGVIVFEHRAPAFGIRFEESQLSAADFVKSLWVDSSFQMPVLPQPLPPLFHMSMGPIEVQEKRGMTISVIRAPWELMSVIGEITDPRWADETGIREAASRVVPFAAARLMHLKTTEPKEILERLQKIIAQFAAVLKQATVEEELQKFLESNPVVLSPTAVRVIPKHQLGAEYITDFVIEEAGREYTIVELESPTRPIFTKKDDFTAWATHAIGQVADWRDWIQENNSYARQSLSGITDPAGLVIMGRDAEMKERHRKRLIRRNADDPHIKLWTYDQLLQRARLTLDNLARMR